MKQLKYKALLSDVDGTLIPNIKDSGLPSERVTQAISKASELIHVGIATSRPLTFSEKILNHLNLTSPCIISGGAQIYDPVKKEILYEKNIDKNSVVEIFKVVNKYGLVLLDDGRGGMGDIKEKDVIYFTQFWIHIPNTKNLDEIISDFSNIPNISIHKIVSRFSQQITEVIINHTEATKQFGILKVAEILEINTHEIIAIGDGYNDFPLLMAAGLKVAMGNGVEDIKEIADYVAPNVEDDGVADVIEKFVLNEKSN
jgi:Cof subfamily protein (haloacid dehalogenase superfamily)